MKVIVEVKGKKYPISCGSGNQDFAWLALTACQRYSKDAFPRGLFLPSLLITSTREIPHPRVTINSTLEDNEEVEVHLKDPKIPADDDEVQWYSRAFGPHRNMMQARFAFKPVGVESNTSLKDIRIFLVYNFKIFPELVDEFTASEFPFSQEIELTPASDAYKEFVGEKMLPYGEITKSALMSAVARPGQDFDRSSLRDISESTLQYVSFKLMPEPISQEKRARIEKEEENEQRKKEEEQARVAQEQLRQEVVAQETPVKTLLDVWPEAPRDLVPHFPLLQDVFSIYSNLHTPVADEELISLHDFLHMLRTFELVSNREALVQASMELSFEKETQVNVVRPAITLKTFLQLLVEFMRTQQQEEDQTQVIIDKLTASKTLWMQDTVKSELIKPEINELFMENEDLLFAKYLQAAADAAGLGKELKVSDFVALAQGQPQLGDTLTSDMLEKLCEDTISFCHAPDIELLYPDFLETLVRLANVLPFSEDDIQKMISEQPDAQILPEKVHSIIRFFCGDKTRTPSAGGSRGGLRPLRGQR